MFKKPSENGNIRTIDWSKCCHYLINSHHFQSVVM